MIVSSSFDTAESDLKSRYFGPAIPPLLGERAGVRVNQLKNQIGQTEVNPQNSVHGKPNARLGKPGQGYASVFGPPGGLL
jgi:hypothetical protein